MDKKKIIIQILVAVVLYTVISVILEKTYTQEIIIAKGQRGLIFGLLYGGYLLVRRRFINKK